MRLDKDHNQILNALEESDEPLSTVEIGMRTDDLSLTMVQTKLSFLISHDYVLKSRDGKNWVYELSDE